MGVVQKAPHRLILNHPHLLPPPHKGEERGDGGRSDQPETVLSVAPLDRFAPLAMTAPLKEKNHSVSERASSGSMIGMPSRIG